jgi:hypothetical protein
MDFQQQMFENHALLFRNAAVNSKAMYAVVSASDALKRPYPFVHVEADGSVRELHQSERNYLEMAFSPFDGGRPYIKSSYQDKNGWGSVEGFCPRGAVPHGVPIGAVPDSDPNPPKGKDGLVEWLKNKMTGFEITERPDGTVSMKNRNRDRSKTEELSGTGPDGSSFSDR